MRATLRTRIAVAASISVALGALGAWTAPTLGHDEPLPDGGLVVSDGHRDAHQHGETNGHLPATSSNVDLVSRLRLKNVVPEKIADVGTHKGYAYLAAWGFETCRYNGVHVVDIRNIASPKEVAFIQAKEGSYPGEGIQALSVTTPKFNGDLLVSNNEKCRAKAGFGGMNLYDVSNPRRPVPLAEGAGDFTVNGQGKKAANETHSVFAWDAGNRAYAVMTDNEEGKDVDIMDITNPKKPFLAAEYDLDELFPQIEQAAPSNLVEVFLHDMIVKEINGRQIMLLSYWDAGYVQVDVTDVHAPTYVSDSDFTDPDPELLESAGIVSEPEGNGHQAEFTDGNAYVVGADEDFDPYRVIATNVDDGEQMPVSQGTDTTKLETGEVIEGGSVFVGRACPGDPAVPPGDPDAVDIAVVERGVCDFTVKVAAVLAAGGYDAVLVFNRVGSDACGQPLGMQVEGDIPTFGVAPREMGFAIFDVEDQYDDAACLAAPAGSELAPVAVGTAGDTLKFESRFDGWGYVHLYDAATMNELDTYAVPEAHDPAHAQGSGDLSVHEVAVSSADPNLLYFSYYAAGFRVARIDNGEIVETGRFIDAGGSNLWGVQTFMSGGQEYVAASDRDFGLYIFQYTGP